MPHAARMCPTSCCGGATGSERRKALIGIFFLTGHECCKTVPFLVYDDLEYLPHHVLQQLLPACDPEALIRLNG